jgi:cupin fold WbuC family metalloprotein
MLIKLIDDKLINEVIQSAQNSARRRSLYSLHERNEEKVHRLIRVLEPESYVQPHKHENPYRMESFIILRGKLTVVIFADDGRVSEHVVLEAGKSPWGVEVPGTIWHTTIALEPDTTLFEVLQGPWDPKTHKKLPQWAPTEADHVGGQAFIARIREELMLY